MAIESGLWIMFGLGFIFGLGVTMAMVGTKQIPTEEKPKGWEDLLHKRWVDGYVQGGRSMLKRINKEVKWNEKSLDYWENKDGKTQ